MFDVIQDHMGGRKFPAGIKQVALEADRQHHDHGEQGAMFQREAVKPEEAIRHAFKLPGPKKTTGAEEAKPAEAKPKSKKLRRKRGESDVDYARRVVAAAEKPERTPVVAKPEETPEQRFKREEREASEFRREYEQARGGSAETESEPPEPAPPDERTLGMFAASMPASSWSKAEDVGRGLGRYVMHAITWEAKNLVRAAVGAARPDAGIDGRQVLARLRKFIAEQTREDQTFARGIGSHPINDATLRGLIQASAQAHVSHLAKSLAIHSMWMQSVGVAA
jgi:hypothetical protein